MLSIQKKSYEEGKRDALNDLEPTRVWDEYYLQGWEDGIYGEHDEVSDKTDERGEDPGI